MLMDLYLLNVGAVSTHREKCIQRIAPYFHPRENESEEDGLMRIAAGLLANHVLDISSDEQITLNNHGKPMHIEGGPPCFNISDDSGHVALACANDVVGVDIMAMGIVDESIAHKHFPPAVYQELIDARDDEKPLLFAKYWSVLEAKLKALGTGLDTDYRHDPHLLDEWHARSFVYKNALVISCATREPFELRAFNVSIDDDGTVRTVRMEEQHLHEID